MMPAYVARAVSEQERIAELLEDPGIAAALGGILSPQVLAWALGMARSRAFDATPGTFVMAPVLDMVNHAWQARTRPLVASLGASDFPVGSHR